MIQIKPPREYHRQNGVLLPDPAAHETSLRKKIYMPLAKSFVEAAVLTRLTWTLRRMAASCSASKHRIDA
jgi:hypothetical protein